MHIYACSWPKIAHCTVCVCASGEESALRPATTGMSTSQSLNSHLRSANR